MKIFLCAGHQYPKGDPGAVYGKKKESVIAKSIVNHTRNWLKSLYGVTPLVVPHAYNLRQAIRWINARSSGLKDKAVEVHINAGGGKGTETYYYAGSSVSKKFATKINDYVVHYTKTRNRGVKPDTSTRFKRLGFVRDTKPLAVLLEAFFIQENIKTERAGKGLAVGIAVYLGLKKKSILKKVTVKVPANMVKKLLAFVKKLLSNK